MTDQHLNCQVIQTIKEMLLATADQDPSSSNSGLA